VVFPTKERRAFLKDQALGEELHRYLKRRHLALPDMVLAFGFTSLARGDATGTGVG
jgi:hypothetical protein